MAYSSTATRRHGAALSLNPRLARASAALGLGRLLAAVLVLSALLLVPRAALAEADRLSVVAEPAVDGNAGPQVAVKWSGITLLPHPGTDAVDPSSWPITDSQSRTLAGTGVISPVFEWQAEPFGPGLDADVLAVTVHQGELIAGGLFTEIGGETVNHIARWDGSEWSPLSGALGTGVNDTVVALTVHDGDLYAAGWFTTAGGVNVNRVARWDGSEWHALSGPSGTGVSGVPVALTSHGSDLIVGGHFLAAGGVTVNRIARWDGSEWSALAGPAGVGMDSTVFALTEYDGDLFAGGGFATAGGAAVGYIARWDGNEWSALADPSGFGTNNQVNALAVHDGHLVASGGFTMAGGVTVNYLARWDGSEWSALSGPSGTGVNGSALALAVHNGDLIAGGVFTTAGGTTAHRIARWDGSSWSALSRPSGLGVNGGVRALTVLDGALIAGGSFTSAGGLPSTRIGRFGIAFFAVGGTVSGLAGNGMVLQNNGGDDLPIETNGTYSFATELEDLGSYAVTVLQQPSDPSQTCVVVDGSGALAGDDVTHVDIVCTTDQFEVGGTISGLRGDQVVLQNNGGDSQTVMADGSFAFTADDGSDYNITVLDQPANPSQTCSVTNGSGTLAAADVSGVVVTCVTDQFTVGGAVTGLLGDQLVLQINGGGDQAITANGGFVFAASDDGTAYAVTVLAQPSHPSQTCSVTNGSGTLSGANVSDIEVACTTDQFTVGGTVTGLLGDQVVLQNNGGDDRVLATDGNFTFAAQDDGSAFDVSVLTQPGNPSQTCAVANGSGVIASENIGHVVVSCTTDSYDVIATTIGNGTISPATQVVEYGAGASFDVTPDAHHHLVSVTGDTCVPVEQGEGLWSADDITEDCAVVAHFERDATDLQIAKDSGLDTVHDGHVVVYTITVANAGPTDVSGAQLMDNLPTNLGNASWACLPAESNSPCPPPPFDAGSGDLYAEIDLPVDGFLRYDLAARVQANGESIVVNTAVVSPPTEIDELDPSNNSASDTTSMDPKIFSSGFEDGAPALTVPAAASAHRAGAGR